MNELHVSTGRLQTAVSPHKSAARSSLQNGMSQAGKMAQEIMARYGQGTAAWRSLSPAFLEVGTQQTSVTHQHNHHSHIQLKPRINLVLNQLNSIPQNINISHSNSSQSATFVWQTKRPVQGNAHQKSLVSRVQQHELVQNSEVRQMAQKIQHQFQPIDLLSHQPKPMTNRVINALDSTQEGNPINQSQAASNQVAPRILRQTKAPMNQDSSAQTTKDESHENGTPFGAQKWQMYTKEMEHGITAVDTNHLADQVMQKLENRLQAHRERTGRI